MYKKLIIALALVLAFSSPTYSQGLPSDGGDGLPSNNLWDKVSSTAINSSPRGLDLGTVVEPLGDIYGGNLFIDSVVLTGNISLPDDASLILGTGNDVRLLYETADANSHNPILVLPEGDATNSTNLIIGDASILDVDLGVHENNTEPGLILYDDTGAKWAELRYDGVDSFSFDTSSVSELFEFNRKVTFNSDITMGPTAAINPDKGFNEGICWNGTCGPRGGFGMETDEGGFWFSGDNDGNGNNALTIASGSNLKSHGHTTHNPDPTLFHHSNSDPATFPLEYAKFFHDKVDYNIETATGDLNLNPVSEVVSIDGIIQKKIGTDIVNSFVPIDHENRDIVRLTAQGGLNYLSNLTPSILPGTFDGQQLTLEGSVSAGFITFQDESNLPNSGLIFENQTDVQIDDYDSIYMTWNAIESKWVEKSRSSNFR